MQPLRIISVDKVSRGSPMTRCCIHCTHFSKYPEGWQMGFYGTCTIGIPTDRGGALSPQEATRMNQCYLFKPRPMEQLVADRLSDGYSGRMVQ
jgi:hypothetical protein